MKIKYLRDAPTAKKEDIVDIDRIYGTALIAMGFAEEVDNTDIKKESNKTTNTSKTKRTRTSKSTTTKK